VTVQPWDPGRNWHCTRSGHPAAGSATLELAV